MAFEHVSKTSSARLKLAVIAICLNKVSLSQITEGASQLDVLCKSGQTVMWKLGK